MDRSRETFATVAPYAVWMALMVLLPSDAFSYAIRTAIASGFLSLYIGIGHVRMGKEAMRRMVGPGIAVGLAVFALWVLPERLEIYRRLFIIGDGAAQEALSPYDPAVCGWAFTVIRLIGSAFVIAPAEELFFRNFLYRWLQKGGDWTSSSMRKFDMGAFIWTVALFALEHDRYLAGAMAGAIYGAIAIRRGLGAAIVAHVTTNFALALYVILRGAWRFW